MNSVPSILQPGAYGNATPAIGELLATAQTLAFFPDITRIGEEEAELARQHLRLARSVVPFPLTTHPSIMLGDATILKQASNAVAQAAPKTLGKWDHLLARYLQTLAEQANTDGNKFKPPLWSSAVPYNVVPILAVSRREQVLKAIDPEDHAVFWDVACDVEEYLWNAIEWELLHEDNFASNPYYPLVKLASRGLYPIGFWGDAFVLFGRMPDQSGRRPDRPKGESAIAE